MSEEDKAPQEHTEVELQAMDKGWSPKEEWDGESDLWVDAGEFIRRGELMDRISDQSRQLRTSQEEINALKEGMDVLTKHNKTIAEQEYKKALADLKSQKADALDMGDNRKVVEIDDRMDELKDARKELDSELQQNNESTTQNNQQIDQRILDWQRDNEWYLSDVAMQGAADAYAMDYVRRNPQAQGDVDTVLSYVSRKMADEFSDRVGGRRKPASSGTVDTGSTGGRGRTKSKALGLTNVERSVAQKLVANGTFKSLEEYSAKLAEIKENG